MTDRPVKLNGKINMKFLDSLHTILCYEGHEIDLSGNGFYATYSHGRIFRNFLFGKNKSLIFIKYGKPDTVIILRIHDDACHFSSHRMNEKPDYLRSGSFKVEKPDLFEDWIDGFITLAGSKLTDKIRITPEEAKSIEKILELVTE